MSKSIVADTVMLGKAWSHVLYFIWRGLKRYCVRMFYIIACRGSQVIIVECLSSPLSLPHSCSSSLLLSHGARCPSPVGYREIFLQVVPPPSHQLPFKLSPHFSFKLLFHDPSLPLGQFLPFPFQVHWAR